MKIASVTKIMTALVALESVKPGATVTVKAAWTGVEGSSVYLKAGQKISVRNLLYGLLMESGNDAATAIAGYVAGSNEAFAELMNRKADALGCENTHFMNPHGLDADGHYSSARDLALIMRAAMANDEFAVITSTKYYNTDSQSWKNHNKLLWDYAGCIGGKTGYTQVSGRTLVSCAERNGLRLICVTLSDANDWDDHAALLDWGFDRFGVSVVSDGELTKRTLPVISGTADFVSVTLGQPYSLAVPKNAVVEVKTELPRFVYADVVRGGLAGYAAIYADGKLKVRVPLYYGETVLRSWSAARLRWTRLA
jgi:D-alanyl-D-alanine carboxypeptidase